MDNQADPMKHNVPIVAVMGVTGAGKSYFVQKATCRDVVIGNDLQSCTTHVESYPMKLGGQSLVLVDTPGFDDTTRSETDVLMQLANWLQMTYEFGYRLSGLLYLHPITKTRMTGSDMRSLRVFTKLVGHALPKIVLVTTQWDLINNSLGIAREAELKTKFWSLAIEEGTIVARFNGDHESAVGILKTCDLDQHFPLLIQEELVVEHKRLSETAAGQAMRQALDEAEARNEKQIVELKKEMQEALEKKENEYLKELMEVEERHNRFTHQLKEQQESLSASRTREMEQLMKDWQDMKTRLEAVESDYARQAQTVESPPPYSEKPFNSSNQRNDESRDPPELLPSTGFTSAFFRFKIVDVFRLYANFRQIAHNTISSWTRPKLRAGYRRISWTCTCGASLYSDLKEARVGSLDQLSAVLNQRAPHAGESYLSHSNSPHGDVATPPPTHTRGRAIIFELHGRSRQVSDEQYYIDNQNSLGTKPMSPVATRFLEICTRQNTFDQILGEIDTSGANSDGLLFQSIQTKYKELKRDMQIQPPNSRSRFRFWGLSGYFSLMKPTGVAFVKVRVHKRPLVGIMANPSLPPESEVALGRYYYAPCPMDEVPMPSHIFMHHFLSNNPLQDHPRLQWAPRLPQKLETSLYFSNDILAIGWGVQILEGPNWGLIWIILTITTSLSGLVAALYAFFVHYRATGVAIGAWLSAIQAMALAAAFYQLIS